MRSILLLPLLLGCPSSGVPEPTDDDDATEAPPPDAEHLFSFVVLADPHIVGEGENADRLRQTVDWVLEEEDARDIELVLVVGDISWGGGIQLSKDILDELPVPFVPILGDNPIQVGDGGAWDAVFGPQIEGLGGIFDGFRRGTVQAPDPEMGVDAWFQNHSFAFGGLRFVSLDFNTRHIGGLLGELADTHDHEHGALPFLREELDALLEGADEDVVLFSHIPMHVPAFDQAEMGAVEAVTAPRRDRVFANFAGHYHGDGHEILYEAGYEVFVTDATWDDVVTLRYVEVWSDGEQVTYLQELVVL